VGIEVIDMAFAPDGHSLAVGGYESQSGSRGIVQIWDLRTGKRSDYESRQSLVHCVAFSPDGRRIIAGCGNGYGPAQTMIIDRERGTTSFWDGGHPMGVYDVCFTPDGGSIVSSGPFDVRVQELHSRKDRFSPPLHVPGAYHVKCSPDGTRIFAACNDATVRAWDAVSGDAALSVSLESRSVPFAIDITANGQHIACGHLPGQHTILSAVMDAAIIPLRAGSDKARWMQQAIRGLRPESRDRRYYVRLARALAELEATSPLTDNQKTDFIVRWINEARQEAARAGHANDSFFDRCAHVAASRQAWQIVGPFSAGFDDANLDHAFPPEQLIDPQGYDGPKGSIPWLKANVYEGDIVELLDVYPGSEHVAAYALAYVSSATEQDIILRFSSDDCARIWVDDLHIYTWREYSPLVGLEMGDRIPLKLSPGVHKLLIKVTNAEFDWAFAIDAEDTDGMPAVLDWSAAPPGAALTD
jgi:hypothetical protein